MLRPSRERKPSLPIRFHDSAQCTIAVSLIFKPSRTALALADVSSRSLEAKRASQACNSDWAAVSLEEERGPEADMREGEEAREREEEEDGWDR